MKTSFLLALASSALLCAACTEKKPANPSPAPTPNSSKAPDTPGEAAHQPAANPVGEVAANAGEAAKEVVQGTAEAAKETAAAAWQAARDTAVTKIQPTIDALNAKLTEFKGKVESLDMLKKTALTPILADLESRLATVNLKFADLKIADEKLWDGVSQELDKLTGELGAAIDAAVKRLG